MTDTVTQYNVWQQVAVDSVYDLTKRLDTLKTKNASEETVSIYEKKIKTATDLIDMLSKSEDTGHARRIILDRYKEFAGQPEKIIEEDATYDVLNEFSHRFDPR